MRVNKAITALAAVAVTSFFLIPLIAHSRDRRPNLAEILSRPDRYVGTVIQIEGRVILPHFGTLAGHPYTTFDIRDDTGMAIGVFSSGTLPVKAGALVRVTGQYQRGVRYAPFTFWNQIDTSEAGVETGSD